MISVVKLTVGFVFLSMVVNCSSSQQQTQEDFEVSDQQSGQEMMDQEMMDEEIVQQAASESDSLAASDEMNSGFDSLRDEETVADSAEDNVDANVVAEEDATMQNRVMRYAKARVSVYSKPDASAAVVGNLSKGDRVIVFEQGEWAKLGNNSFVKLDELSDSIVSRDRKPAVWQSTGH